MLNKFTMQIKRELWQNKSLIFSVPVGFSMLSLLILLAILSYFSSFGYIGPNLAGNLTITTKLPTQVGEKHDIFDSSLSKDIDSLTKVEHQFPANRTLAQTNNTHSSGMSIDNYHKLTTAYFVFELIVLILVTILLGRSVVSDRKDRSILFWRSLPVSESFNVLTKLFVATIILPAIYITIGLFTLLSMNVVFMITEWLVGISNAAGISHSLGSVIYALFNMVGWFFVTVIWALPFLTWAMLCSAQVNYSRQLLFILPPLALMFVEFIFLDSAHIKEAIFSYFSSGMELVRDLTLGETIDFDVNLFAIGMLCSVCFLIASIWSRKLNID